MVREVTPFSLKPKGMTAPAKEPDPEKAKEVTPITLFGLLPPILAPQGLDLRAIDHDVRKTPIVIENRPKVEVEGDDDPDDDPKAPVTSSATSNASPSENDTSESGAQTQDETSMILHPSFLPPSPETPASAEKGPNDLPPL